MGSTEAEGEALCGEGLGYTCTAHESPVLLLARRCRVLGLDVCIDTVCGNDLLKGISGGQKKRVTTGEMTVGRLPVLFMDEISTGLDRCGVWKECL